MAITALRQHLAQQVEERGAAGNAWHGGLVFPNLHGGPLQRNNLLTDSFAPLLAKAGLPRIRFHDLRHTAAIVMLLHEMHPKVVAEMPGHAFSITLDTYSHVLPTMQRVATAAIDRLWRKP